MKSESSNTYNDYVRNVTLYNNNGNKIIVVLVSNYNNGKKYETESDDVKSRLELRMNNMIDSVSLAILKIHNIVNSGSNIYNRDEFINSILSSLTNEFPEFMEYLNDNASYLNNNGKATVMIIDLKRNMMLY